MVNTKNIQREISVILFLGIILATLLLVLGAGLYLWQEGNKNFTAELANTLQTAPAWPSPLGIITLGLFTMVLTQVLRVALLAIFYIKTRDISFAAFSLFILAVLIYSLI
jgi:uncharacterized membrane protein